jgi:hypothetical protein
MPPPTERDLVIARELGAMDARIKTCETRQKATDETITRIFSRLRQVELRVAGIVFALMVLAEFARWWITGGIGP